VPARPEFLQAWRKLRPHVLLFLGLSVVYHSNLRPIGSTDTFGASLTPLAIVLDHSVYLDRFGPWLYRHFPFSRGPVMQSRGHYFSGFPVGAGILVTPLYLPLALARNLPDWQPGSLVMLAIILQKFAATTIAALSSVVLLLLLKRLTSPAWAWALTLVYALATPTWSISSQAMWQHGPGELAIIGTLLFLQRWSEQRDSRELWMCGFCAACALMVRPTNIVLLPAMLAALLVAKAVLAEHARFWVLPAAGGLLTLLYNLYVFHRVSGSQSAAELTTPLLAGLAGIFLSPGRGLLIYTPVAIFALCAFLPHAAAERRKHLPLLFATLIFTLLHCVVIAKWRDWWGGYCWGPRLLTEIMPPLIVLMALGSSVLEMSWPRRSFAVLAVWCCGMQILGAYFYPKGYWDVAPRPAIQAPQRLWDWSDNPIRRTLLAGPTWGPYSIVGAALTGGLPAATRRMRELRVNPYDRD
jgi:hypothetical protein